MTILELADKIQKELGVKVSERQFSIHELINSGKEGRLLSMFGASTHCPLMPINRVCYRDTTILLDEPIGKDFNEKLNKMMVDVMTGDASHPWITPME